MIDKLNSVQDINLVLEKEERDAEMGGDSHCGALRRTGSYSNCQANSHSTP
jgi:hypothetical protein